MSEIEEILEAQHKYFYTGETKKLAFRIAMLKRLEEAVIRHEKELLLALQKDLAKAPFEGYETEVGIVRRELADTIAHLKQWDKPKHNLQRTLWQRTYYVTVELSGAADVNSIDWCHSSR